MYVTLTFKQYHNQLHFLEYLCFSSEYISNVVFKLVIMRPVAIVFLLSQQIQQNVDGNLENTHR